MALTQEERDEMAVGASILADRAATIAANAETAGTPGGSWTLMKLILEAKWFRVDVNAWADLFFADVSD